MIRAGFIFNPNINWFHKVEENYFVMTNAVDFIKPFLNKYQPINRKKVSRFLANLSDDRISRVFVYIDTSAYSIKAVIIIMLYGKQLIVIYNKCCRAE